MNDCSKNRAEGLISEILEALHAKVVQFNYEQLVVLLPAASPADFGTWLCGEYPQVRQIPEADLQSIYSEFRRLLRSRLALVPIPHWWLGVA